MDAEYYSMVQYYMGQRILGGSHDPASLNLSIHRIGNPNQILFEKIFGPNHEHVISYLTSFLVERPDLVKNYISVKSIYRGSYVPVTSDRQIVSLAKVTRLFHLKDYHRLIELLSRWIDPKYYSEVTKAIDSAKSDRQIYDTIFRYLKYNGESVYTKSTSRARAIAKTITKYLQGSSSKDTLSCYGYRRLDIKSILDLGCTNGKKVVAVAKELGIPPERTFGIDIEDWYGLQKKKTQALFNFILIKENQRFPVNDGAHDLILFQMTMHHIINLDWYMRELNRITKMGGWIYVREHDAFTEVDYMLVDVEHMMWLHLLKNRRKRIHDNVKAYYGSYFDWAECSVLFQYYGFKRHWGGLTFDSIRKDVSITRAYFALYRKESSM